MTIQITIVGLGQVGTSIGLALAGKKDLVVRVGHDLDYKIAQKAQKLGAVDRVSFNLPNVIREADIVVLALPVDQIQETLKIIAQDLKEEAVVMDTAPVKDAVAHWAAEYLPENRHYVGLTPAINPAYLEELHSGQEAAHADLFKDGVMAIVAPSQTASEAIKLAADFSRLLGSTPLFTDPVEIDSLMAATHILPQLLTAALLNITVDQPGWREGRKVAGRPFAAMTALLNQQGQPGAVSTSCVMAHQNMVRVLDSVIAALQAMRSDIASQDTPALTARLERAQRGREVWWHQRQKANWLADEMPKGEMPKASDVFRNLVGLGRKNRRTG
jgi:prephenate dehydrogenase